MFKSKLLIMLLAVFSVISFSIVALGAASNSGWKASPELVESLTKRRSGTNYSEKRVPKYTLPNPLVLLDGKRVTNAGMWRTERRPEILELFRKYNRGFLAGPCR